MSEKAGAVQSSIDFQHHPQHLDTPRQITDTAGNIVWQWDNSDPFGNNVPNENPSGLGVFEFNKRYDGQYFDRETGTHYNFFRDCYDPATGRYCQSDPIGLAGGSWSTYIYVNSNPLSYFDPFGLADQFGTFSNPPRFFNLTTFASLQRGITLDQAIRDGALTRGVTLPAIGVAASGDTIGLAATAPAAANVCYKAAKEVAKELRKPCQNTILAAALGTGICNGDPADDFVQDILRKEEIKRGAELSGQRRIGMQSQRP